MARHSTTQGNFPKPETAELELIITKAEGAETLVRYAKEIGKALADQRLTTSQIRAIFGEVRRIEGDWKSTNNATRANRSLILLKPKMAYRAKRETGQGVKNLVSVLEPAIDLVEGNEDNFNRFVEFLEAILAYHKAYGGN
jgi:CRISPR-associated protein Csm2